jgi:23S rRNA (adenine2503-C2)-methyltransferase
VVKPLPLVFDAPRGKKPPTHLLDLDRVERRSFVSALGMPAFRADQLSSHVIDQLNDDPETWSDLSIDVRNQLVSELLPTLLEPVTSIACDEGTTVKTLWKLHDGVRIESVLMRYPNRVTMCISSQAGCGMACPFCATGQGGLMRNLSTAEIVEQVRAGSVALKQGNIAGGPGRVSNIVFMGMGEPLANYRAVMKAVRLLTSPAPEGMGIGARGITISTVGLAPRIRELATEGIPVTLAVSLHAPDDELRDTLVPVNNRWPVQEVLDAAWEYAAVTKRRVSIEYALIRNINDQRWRAELLAERLIGRLVHVNLIPLNPTPGSKWTASDPQDERAFVSALKQAGVPVTVRDTRGRDIDGACGQLAAST